MFWVGLAWLVLACAAARPSSAPKASVSAPASAAAAPSSALALIAPVGSTEPSVRPAPAMPEAAAPPKPVKLELSGYVGRRAILATLTITSSPDWAGPVGDAWQGSYEQRGQGQQLRLVGQGTGAPDFGPMGEMGDIFSCEFDAFRADQRVGHVDASCSVAEGRLVVDGAWTDPAGSGEVPFFLGQFEAEIAYFAYHGAALDTPVKARACAPYVASIQAVSMPAERELVSYLLTWPCDEKASPHAFLAMSVGTPEPGSGKFATRPLDLGAVAVGSELSLGVVDGDWGDARVGQVLTTEHDQPDRSWRASDAAGWLVPISPSGKLGRPVSLGKAHVTRGTASCLNQSSDFDVQHVDLDGKPPEEVIVARHHIDEKPRPSPDYECDIVEATSYVVYRFVTGAQNAELVRMGTPKGIEEKLGSAEGVR